MNKHCAVHDRYMKFSIIETFDISKIQVDLIQNTLSETKDETKLQYLQMYN